MRQIATYLVFILCLQACGVHYLAPEPPPPRVQPPLSLSVRQPPAGETLVTLDVVGEPARVDRIVGRQHIQQVYAGRRSSTQTLLPALETVPLCQSPCVVALPPGDHELLFSALDPGSSATSSAFIRVGTEPLLVRHAMGFREEHPGRMVAAILLGSLGFSASLTGGILAGVAHELPQTNAGMATTGWTVGGVGLLAVAAAIWLGANSGTVVQPGSTATYPALGL